MSFNLNVTKCGCEGLVEFRLTTCLKDGKDSGHEVFWILVDAGKELVDCLDLINDFFNVLSTEGLDVHVLELNTDIVVGCKGAIQDLGHQYLEKETTSLVLRFSCRELAKHTAKQLLGAIVLDEVLDKGSVECHHGFNRGSIGVLTFGIKHKKLTPFLDLIVGCLVGLNE